MKYGKSVMMIMTMIIVMLMLSISASATGVKYESENNNYYSEADWTLDDDTNYGTMRHDWH